MQCSVALLHVCHRSARGCQLVRIWIHRTRKTKWYNLEKLLLKNAVSRTTFHMSSNLLGKRRGNYVFYQIHPSTASVTYLMLGILCMFCSQRMIIIKAPCALSCCRVVCLALELNSNPCASERTIDSRSMIVLSNGLQIDTGNSLEAVVNEGPRSNGGRHIIAFRKLLFEGRGAEIILLIDDASDIDSKRAHRVRVVCPLLRHSGSGKAGGLLLGTLLRPTKCDT